MATFTKRQGQFLACHPTVTAKAPPAGKARPRTGLPAVTYLRLGQPPRSNFDVIVKLQRSGADTREPGVVPLAAPIQAWRSRRRNSRLDDEISTGAPSRETPQVFGTACPTPPQSHRGGPRLDKGMSQGERVVLCFLERGVDRREERGGCEKLLGPRGGGERMRRLHDEDSAAAVGRISFFFFCA